MKPTITKSDSPIAEDVEFDNTTNDFDSDDTQLAIEEAADSSFSHWHIPSGKTIKIKANKQMAVHSTLEIDGYLEIEGQLIVEE